MLKFCESHKQVSNGQINYVIVATYCVLRVQINRVATVAEFLQATSLFQYDTKQITITTTVREGGLGIRECALMLFFSCQIFALDSVIDI